MVNEIVHCEGYICVYLTATKETIEFIENFDSYFSINRTPLYQNPTGRDSLFDALDDKVGRIYTKGIWAWFTPTPALFDYDFSTLPLNEERSLKDTYSLFRLIGDMWAKLSDLNVIHRILELVDEDESSFEMGCPNFYLSSNVHSAWKEGWTKYFGPKAVLVDKNIHSTSNIFAAAGELGYKPIHVDSEFMYTLLNTAGVATIYDIVGEKGIYEEVVLKPWQQDLFDQAITIISEDMPRITTLPIITYRPNDDQKALGMYFNDEKTIGISEVVFEEGLNKVVAVLVHELDHHISGHDDCTNEFRHVADMHIARLLIEKYGNGHAR
jgi:hypothetical protein